MTARSLPSTSLVLALFTFALGYAAFHKGGASTPEWNASLLPLGLGAVILQWTRPKGHDRKPRLSWWLLVPLLALPLLAAVQLLPMPLNVVGMLSPQRAEQIGALQTIAPISWAPLSVVPPATVDYGLRLIAYVVLLFSIRTVFWHSADHPWRLIVPLLTVAGFESLLGMLQVMGDSSKMAVGTYVDHDHFSGLMEIVLPFAVMYAWAIWAKHDWRFSSPVKPAAAVAIVGSLAALMLLAITASQSRMGFIVMLASLTLLAVTSILPRLPSPAWRFGFVLLLMASATVAFLFLPSDQLIGRFALLASNSAETITADERPLFWKQTVSLIKAYPLTGCGLGAFESAFRPFQATLPVNTIDYAHNDYLQFLAELGIPGFAMLILLVIAVVSRTVRAIGRPIGAEERYLAVACLASIGAMLFHSMVDFNMQLPANALAMAWVGGIALGIKIPRYRAA